MHPAIKYTPYDKFSRGKNGNIITFTQFEEGDLLYKTSDDAESGGKYDKD